MTNASASKPRTRNARMKAITICSMKSRFDSFGFGAFSFSLLFSVAFGLAVVRLIGGSFEGPGWRRTGRGPRSSNVPDFAGVGNPVKLPAEHLQRHALPRQVDEERLAQQPPGRHHRAVRPEP